MRRLLVIVVATFLGVIGNAATASAATSLDINQHPVGGSGIQGRIEVTDTGSSLVVHGTATGLNPAHAYFSLIYTLGSHPGGPAEGKSLPSTSNAIAPCADLNQAGVSTITGTQMVVGFWINNHDGTGTLNVIKSASGNSQDALFASLPAPPGTKFPNLLAFIQADGGINSYAPIGTWSTMSIRDVNLGFALQACGEAQGTGSGR